MREAHRAVYPVVSNHFLSFWRIDDRRYRQAHMSGNMPSHCKYLLVHVIHIHLCPERVSKVCTYILWCWSALQQGALHQFGRDMQLHDGLPLQVNRLTIRGMETSNVEFLDDLISQYGPCE